jgi:hypothetical protein
MLDKKSVLNLFKQFISSLKTISKRQKKLILFFQKQVSTFMISYNNGLADIVRNAETGIKTFRGERCRALGERRF